MNTLTRNTFPRLLRDVKDKQLITYYLDWGKRLDRDFFCEAILSAQPRGDMVQLFNGAIERAIRDENVDWLWSLSEQTNLGYRILEKVQSAPNLFDFSINHGVHLQKVKSQPLFDLAVRLLNVHGSLRIELIAMLAQYTRIRFDHKDSMFSRLAKETCTHIMEFAWGPNLFKRFKQIRDSDNERRGYIKKILRFEKL